MSYVRVILYIESYSNSSGKIVSVTTEKAEPVTDERPCNKLQVLNDFKKTKSWRRGRERERERARAKNSKSLKISRKQSLGRERELKLETLSEDHVNSNP